MKIGHLTNQYILLRYHFVVLLTYMYLLWYILQLEKIRSLSGIQGIARSEEESTLQQESAAEDASNSGSVSDVNNPTQFGSHSTSPVDGGTGGTLTNPGKAIFIHPPYLITELYPPGIVVQDSGLLGDILTNGSVEDLKSVLCGQLLPLAYVGKPCPVELSQWLFQLMGCSSDHEISSAALRSLVGLLQYARRQEKVFFSLPSVDEVTDVLVSLGADREKLRPLIIGRDQVQAMPVDQKREASFAHPPSTNLLNVISYLSACIQMFPNYTVQQLEDLVLILSSLSLDHHCRHLLKLNLKTCIHYILAAYPESVWPKAVKRLSPQLCCLSQHHQDRLLLARLISGSMPRERYLVKDFCQQCLTQMVEPSSTRLPAETFLTNTDENYSSEEKNKDMHAINDTTSNSCDGELPTTSSEVMKTQSHLHSDPMEVPDYMFFTKVLKSYQKEVHGETTNEEYCKMHSLLHLLQLYAPVSDLTFPSEPVKQEFIDMLGTLRANIKDDIMRPITSTVKDILIRMKLELESQTVGREKRQTNLFSFSS